MKTKQAIRIKAVWKQCRIKILSRKLHDLQRLAKLAIAGKDGMYYLNYFLTASENDAELIKS
ncbi:hypothetical protein [Flavobacterium phragmitis]|uniref:hypothetical protein n=1 Tax=Flavobacterium phragmitis TaxID=739143 RepID=UPI000B899BA4|nr:hypothetical protein [Flavobacterium phragmitis]